MTELFKPDGVRAGKIERIMLLLSWAKHLEAKQDEKQVRDIRHKMIIAGIGRPTYPLNPAIVEEALNYWENIQNSVARAYAGFANDPMSGFEEPNSVIGYGEPQGEFNLRERVANALTGWYGEAIQLRAEHILFTVGGAGALYAIFEVINAACPNGFIVTPFPYYTLYAGVNNQNNLHPIHVMEQPGYRLSAQVLEESLHALKEKQGQVSAFLFCDPNNPIGSFVPVDEWKRIAAILRNYEGVPIILDEAYAEMQLNGEPYQSLLKVAPDLADRIILMRSATKAFSAAGERMAIVVAKDPNIMAQLLAVTINAYAHAPKFQQAMYTRAIEDFNQGLITSVNAFYRQRVDYVFARLQNMGAAMPDPHYYVEATFYVMADLSDMFGMEMTEDVHQVFVDQTSGKIETDEDIAYHLLFSDNLMIAPLSYYGLDPHLGYLRITCCGGEVELNKLMGRIANRLVIARRALQKRLRARFQTAIAKTSLSQIAIEKIHHAVNDSLSDKPENLDAHALQLKHTNHSLRRLIEWVDSQSQGVTVTSSNDWLAALSLLGA